MTSVFALFLGMGLAGFVEWLSRRERSQLKLPRLALSTQLIRAGIVILVTALLFGSYQWASIDLKCLETAEVRPSGWGEKWRLAYHLTLIALLIVATAVDFDCYMIPDTITVPGMLIGFFGACIFRELQISHLWVDWSIAVPQLRGPYIPAWYDTNRFLHAAAWSLAGMVTGAGLTLLARQVSTKVLGQEAMGLGDVTLMAMIGGFIGWQAVILAFLVAPLTGITVGVLIRMLSGKPYLPYGPWLSIGAVIVLFTWTTLWQHTRLIFSDGIGVAILAVIGGGGFVLLLLLLRLYKTIPTRVKPAPSQPAN